MGVSRRVLVITGAGASTALGADGRPLPLMSEWATGLCTDLNQIEVGLQYMVGLEPNMSGVAFEEGLGRFLAGFSSMERVEAISALGRDPGTPQMDHLAVWLAFARARGRQALEAIRDNLYGNFGNRRIDPLLAHNAYTKLAEWLQADIGTTHLWFATTNYDQSIEIAFESSEQYVVEDGFQKASRVKSSYLEPLGLSKYVLQTNKCVPVLHLHGAVGWYYEGSQIRIDQGDQPYNISHGEPALLLPDSTKTESSLVGGDTLWVEFKELIASATHIIFLGHSLNDLHLAKLVRRAGKPTAILEYAKKGTFDEDKHGRRPRMFQGPDFWAVESFLCDFGADAAVELKAFRSWLDREDSIMQ